MILPIRQFVPSDAYLIAPNAIESGMISGEKDWQKWAELNADNGPAYCILYDNRPIVVCGIQLYTNEDGQTIGCCWMMMHQDAVKIKFSVLRSVRTIMNTLIDTFKFKLLLSGIDKRDCPSCRFIEHLGFTRSDKQHPVYHIYERKF